jgi:hypothetical protein
VATGSGKSVFVKKHYAEVALGVVGGYDKPAVHVGMTARFVDQKLAKVVKIFLCPTAPI